MKAVASYGIIKKFGKVMRLKYPDGSKVYLTNKGLTITVKKSKFKKEWKKKKEDFGIMFNNVELELLMKSLGQCGNQWKIITKEKKEKEKE